MSNQRQSLKPLKPVKLPEPVPLYCLLCLVITVQSQLQQAKQGIPEIEMMVPNPNLALTWGPANVNGKEQIVPLCGNPEHLGVKA